MQRKHIGFLLAPRFFIFAGMDQPVMTTIGDALKQYMSEQDKQSALALRWLELWRERHPKKTYWQPSTVESQFSRLMKSDPQGVRFFFEEPARADLLLEVLGVPTGEHAHIRALAEKIRQPHPRLVIDISEWPGRGEPLEALFDELEKKVLRECPLQPIALVLTEQQWAKAPRTYDDLRAVRMHKVDSAEDGQSMAIELAADGSLVLAPWRFDVIERWIAAEFTKNTLTLEPGDGIAVFADQGSLPAIPAVEHPLDQICEPAAITFNVEKFTPSQRRWWVYTLASEVRTIEALKHNDGIRLPARRLAFAQQLGAIATSTERERLEHELDRLTAQIQQELSLPVEQLDAVAHDERLARAALRPTPAAAWRLGDTIHLLHADAPVEHPRIEVHRPAPVVPALTRLLQHLSDWSEDEHETDPSLARAVEALDPEGHERRAFVFARAAVLWNGLSPAPQPASRCERWADELRAVLAHDPPPTSLRLQLPKPASERQCNFLSFEDDDRLCASLPSPSDLLMRPFGGHTLIADRRRTVLRIDGSPLSVTEVTLDTRSKGSVEVEWKQERDRKTFQVFAGRRDQWYGHKPNLPVLWLPNLEAPTPDVDLWLDCLERSSALTSWKWEDSERCDKLLRSVTRARFEVLEGDTFRAQALKIDPAVWLEADMLLAQCWLALRAALERPLSVQLSTGVVCSLGAGVCAHLAVHTHRAGAPAGFVAAFDATVDNSAAKIDFGALWTHAAQVNGYGAVFGVRVPSKLVIRTSTISASITFLASPLLQASTPAPIGSMASMVAAQIADEEARAAWDDDD